MPGTVSNFVLIQQQGWVPDGVGFSAGLQGFKGFGHTILLPHTSFVWREAQRWCPWAFIGCLALGQGEDSPV